MGAGGDGPLGGMAGMEPHHMNGSLGKGTAPKQYHQCLPMFLYIVHFFIFSTPGSGDMDSLPKVSVYCVNFAETGLIVALVHDHNCLSPLKNSPGNLSISNQPGTPREDGEMGGNFLNPFQNESVSWHSPVGGTIYK